MQDRGGRRDLLDAADHAALLRRTRRAAQAGVEVEVERRIRLHPGLAGEDLALLDVLGRQGLLVHVVHFVAAGLAAAHAGPAHAFAAVERDVDAVAQGSVEKDLVALHGEEQGFAIGKTEGDLVAHGAYIRAIRGGRNRAPS
ncbi:hypothetical protein D3C72_2020710 [compost metagenome]